jgi:fatty acid desaturase
MTQHKALAGLLIASAGAGLTAALAFTQAGTPWHLGITIALAVLTPAATYLGVYLTPNRQPS